MTRENTLLWVFTFFSFSFLNCCITLSWITNQLHFLVLVYLHHHTCSVSSYSLLSHTVSATADDCSLFSVLLPAKPPSYWSTVFSRTAHSKEAQLSSRNRITSYPKFESIFVFNFVHVFALFLIHLMPHDFFLRQWLSLGSVFITRGFVCERLYKFISENFDVGSAIALESVGGLGWFFPYRGWSACVAIIRTLIFFGDDDGWVGIASEDSFIPHEVVVDEFAG